MIEFNEILETNKMIDEEKLDVRTITMGISLLECADTDINRFNDKVYDRITGLAENLVKTGEEIENEYGIPIVNKRISVTPVALAAGSAAKSPDDFVSIARTLDRAAHTTGVNFLGG